MLDTRTHALYAASNLAMFLIDPTCLITGANRAAERLTGWSEAELKGRKACSELFASGNGGSPTCPGLCPDQLPYGADVHEGPAQAWLAHRSGKRIPVMTSPVQLERGHAVIFWDVTAQQELEAETIRRRRHAEALSRIGREILAYAGISSGLDRILDQARSLFEMDLVAWGLLDEQARTITWQAARGESGARFPGVIMPTGQGVLERLLLSARPYITRNLAGENRQTPAAWDLFGSPPFLSAVAVPYRVRDTQSAVLLTATRADRPLTDEDVMLITNLGAYLATALENAELLGEVKQMAALEERQRLARDIHDSVGQTLSYFGVRLHMIAKAAARGETGWVTGEAAGLRQVLAETHTELRAAIFRLQQDGRTRISLQERWLHLVSRFEERSGISVTFHLAGTAAALLPDNVQAQLTRILQEALANVRNHSGAGSVAVRLEEQAGGELRLTIADDGCGFDTSEALGRDQHHFGLAIMRERAEAIGAALELRSMRGQGTTVSVRIPGMRRGA